MSNHTDLRHTQVSGKPSDLQMYPGNNGKGMVRLHKLVSQQSQYHNVYAPSPPLRVKDVIFSPQYARGQTIHSKAFMYKGNQVRHQIVDPVSGNIFYQDYSPKGGQMEGF